MLACCELTETANVNTVNAKRVTHILLVPANYRAKSAQFADNCRNQPIA